MATTSTSSPPPPAAITVKIFDIKCLGLPRAAFRSIPNKYYVRLTLDGSTRETPFSSEGSWMQAIHINASMTSMLTFRVFAHHTLRRDKLVGSASGRIDSLLEEGTSGSLAITRELYKEAPSGMSTKTQTPIEFSITTTAASFRSLVERSITAWHSLTYVGDDKAFAIERHSQTLRSLSSVETLIENQQFWFFQLRESFIRQKVLMKWDPARLDEYVLLPVNYGFVNKRDCFFISHYWHYGEHPDPKGHDMHLFREDLSNVEWSYIWVDWTCLPQAPRSEAQQAYFKKKLEGIPMLIRNCGFEWRFSTFRPRAWILYEVAVFMLTQTSYITTADLKPFISHVAEMFDKGVHVVIFEYRYACTEGSDLQLITAWLDLLIALTKVVPDITKRREILDFAERSGVGSYSDPGYGIEIERSLSPHPNRPIQISLEGPAAALYRRFPRTGFISGSEDTEEEIALAREALKLRPTTHPDHLSTLDYLASILYTRFGQASRIEDIEEAIILYREALELRSVPHPHRASSLCDLACALFTRFDHTGNIEDIEEVVSLHREALNLRPATHSGRDRSDSLNYLASALSRRFKETGHIEDKEEATALYKEIKEMFELQPKNTTLKLTVI